MRDFGALAANLQSRIVMVTSGKGGVGTSVVASLLAIAAAERGERVLLLDACEGSGALHQLWGLRPDKSLWHLASRSIRPESIVHPIRPGLSVAAGGTSGGADLPADDGKRRGALSRGLGLAADYDRVIVDAGSRFDTLIAIATVAPRAAQLLVTTADRFSLAANYAVIKTLASRTPSSMRVLLANRHSESVAKNACEFLTNACEHFLDRTIMYVGSLPEDACLQAAVGAGMPIQEALEGSPAAEMMRTVLPRLIPESAGSAGRDSGMLAFPSLRRWS
jgi:flagellar biosynthesis protein FlhG